MQPIKEHKSLTHLAQKPRRQTWIGSEPPVAGRVIFNIVTQEAHEERTPRLATEPISLVRNA